MTRIGVFAVFVSVGWLGSVGITRAEEKGQADLDQALELQVTAKTPDELQEVARLCESALSKGLDKGNEAFAKQVLASTLFERSQRLAMSLLDRRGAPMREQWEAARKDAIAGLEKATTHNPKLGEAFLLIARLETLPGGSLERAKKAIDKAIVAYESDKAKGAAAHVLRAQIVPEAEEKLADLSKAIAMDPTNSDAWEMRALLYFSMNEFEKAVGDIQKILEKDENNIPALTALVRAYTSLKNWDEAFAASNKLIELNPDNAAGYMLRASIHVAKEDLDTAIADLGEGVKIAPRDVRAVLMRSELYLQQKKFKDARQDAERSLQLRPGLVEGLLQRSQISLAEEKLPSAIADLLLILEQGNNPNLRLELARLFAADGRPRRAIEEYDRVLELAKDNPQILQLRATTLLGVGKHTEAVADFNKALSQIPDDEHVLNNLSWVLSTSPDDKLRDGKRALELGKRACEVTDYKAAYILSTYAAAFAELGDFENALKWSEKAVTRSEEELKEADQEGEKKRLAEQLDHLRQELDSYKQGKPWRERQEMKENTERLPASGSE